MIHGEWVRPTSYKPEGYIRPEVIAEHDEKPYHRPCQELLRRWCGTKVVERRDELHKLRHEVHRLGLLTKAPSRRSATPG